jgi:hypothetical protein
MEQASGFVQFTHFVIAPQDSLQDFSERSTARQRFYRAVER